MAPTQTKLNDCWGCPAMPGINSFEAKWATIWEVLGKKLSYQGEGSWGKPGNS